MSKVWLAPSGKLIEGHVLDCARRPLEAKMREYCGQLYLRWNPQKLRGWGLWEVRIRPENKEMVDYAVYEGNAYVRLEYNERDHVNHVLDVAFLNYKLIEKLKSMDTWETSYKAKNFTDQLEAREAAVLEKEKAKAIEDKNYMVKQHKSEIRDFMDFVATGGNPYRIADHWNKS